MNRFLLFAIVKGSPNDIYFIIEGPCLGYFTEKVSQAQVKAVVSAGISLHGTLQAGAH